jgi:hypothetical protein
MGYPDKYYWGEEQYWKDFNCNLTIYERLHICHAPESHIIPGGKGFDDPDVEVHSFGKEGTGLGYQRERREHEHKHSSQLGSRVTLLAKKNAKLVTRKNELKQDVCSLRGDVADLEQDNWDLLERLRYLTM